MTRVFGVDYRFLACGEVFTDGLAHAAAALGIAYDHAHWDVPDLPERIKRWNPDLLFVVHGRKFVTRWKKLPGAYPSAVWLLDEPYEVDDCASWSHLYRSQFLCDPGTLHRHQNATYLPVCYDPAEHIPRERMPTHGSGGMKPVDYAVGFIGGGNSTRDRFLGALARAGLLTYVIGGPWSDPDVQRLCKSGNIPARDTTKWYQQTRIIINVFRERHHFNREQIPATSMNPRIYEALACGALVVSEWRPEIAAVVPELPTFRTVDECLALVRALLTDPELATALQRTCAARLASHTYAQRLHTVLTTCGLAEVAA